MNKTGYIHSSSRSDAVYPYFLFPAKDVPVYPFRRSGRQASGGLPPAPPCIMVVRPEGNDSNTGGILCRAVFIAQSTIRRSS